MAFEDDRREDGQRGTEVLQSSIYGVSHLAQQHFEHGIVTGEFAGVPHGWLIGQA